MHAAFSSQQKAVCVIKSRCFMAVRCPLNQELAYTLNQTITKQRVARFRHSTDTRLHGCTFVLKALLYRPIRIDNDNLQAGDMALRSAPPPPPPPPPPPKLNKEYGPPDREFPGCPRPVIRSQCFFEGTLLPSATLRLGSKRTYYQL